MNGLLTFGILAATKHLQQQRRRLDRSASLKHGTYDPAPDLVLWAVGNPGPDFSGEPRSGPNLYTIRLWPATGGWIDYLALPAHCPRRPVLIPNAFVQKVKFSRAGGCEEI